MNKALDSFFVNPEFVTIAKENGYRLSRLCPLNKRAKNKLPPPGWSCFYFDEDQVKDRRKKLPCGMYIPRENSEDEDDEYGNKEDYYCSNNIYVLYKDEEFLCQFTAESPSIFISGDHEPVYEVFLEEFNFLNKHIPEAIKNNNLIPIFENFNDYVNSDKQIRDKIGSDNIVSIFNKEGFKNISKEIFLELIGKLNSNSIYGILRKLKSLEEIKDFVDRDTFKKTKPKDIVTIGIYSKSEDIISYGFSLVTSFDENEHINILLSAINVEDASILDFVYSKVNLEKNLLEEIFYYAAINNKIVSLKYLSKRTSNKIIRTTLDKAREYYRKICESRNEDEYGYLCAGNYKLQKSQFLETMNFLHEIKKVSSLEK
jgi:hypothetical protein